MGASNRQVEKGNHNRAQLQSFQKRGDPARSHLRPGLAKVGSGSDDHPRQSRASVMRLHVVADGALEGGRPRMGDAGGWLNSWGVRVESLLSLGRDLAASMRDSILRHASRRGASRIHVSAMSETWLRMHETEFDKHRAEP